MRLLLIEDEQEASENNSDKHAKLSINLFSKLPFGPSVWR